MKDIGKGGDGERETVRAFIVKEGLMGKQAYREAHAKFGLC